MCTAWHAHIILTLKSIQVCKYKFDPIAEGKRGLYNSSGRSAVYAAAQRQGRTSPYGSDFTPRARSGWTNFKYQQQRYNRHGVNEPRACFVVCTMCAHSTPLSVALHVRSIIIISERCLARLLSNDLVWYMAQALRSAFSGVSRAAWAAQTPTSMPALPAL